MQSLCVKRSKFAFRNSIFAFFLSFTFPNSAESAPSRRSIESDKFTKRQTPLTYQAAKQRRQQLQQHQPMDSSLISSMKESSLSTTGAITVATLVFAYGLWHHQSVKRKSNYPPMAPVTMMEAILAFGSVDFPFFLLQIARSLGTTNFRMPIPVFPAPMAVMIGDATVARAILTDPQSTKTLMTVSYTHLTLPTKA